MMRIVMGGAAVALGLAGCAMSDTATRTGPAAPAAASADIHDGSGRLVGTATARQVGADVRIRIEATALPPGIHGAHIHTAGMCAPPDFTSAGGHWNPTSHQHGKDNPAGMHMGDLPNLTVGANGRGHAEFNIANASIAGAANMLLDADGAAIVIHAQADDYKTDPSGNSGGRIACGVFR